MYWLIILKEMKIYKHDELVFNGLKLNIHILDNIFGQHIQFYCQEKLCIQLQFLAFILGTKL